MRAIHGSLGRVWAVIVGGVVAGCSSGAEFTPAPDASADGGLFSDAPAPLFTTCNIDAAIVHGVRADGRVDVSAAEAWPNRPAEPVAPSPPSLLGACAVLAACFVPKPVDGGVLDVDALSANAIQSCLAPQSHGNEERAIPEFGQNERWSFKVRDILAKGGCAGTIASTKLPEGVVCQEDGCWWNPALALPTVTCAGDVASLTTPKGTATRDCSHAFAQCNPSSPTGCSDRGPVTCQSAGNDRCDGNIKLGCDRCGLVSFHDCGVMGGRCVENPGGAACVYPETGACLPKEPTCDGKMLTACVGASPVTVDCTALGLKGCERGHCVAL
ncbi:MAG TPA: hypothetical protein VJT73_08635 [Polyangiaceae bacterium]|nr:hypothetical protein [Polyangiaceae bacterium]